MESSEMIRLDSGDSDRVVRGRGAIARIVLGMLLLATMPDFLGAQILRPMAIPYGTRVRITVPANQQIVGSWMGLQQDSLLLSAAGGNVRFAIPRASAQTLEYSERPSRARWAGIGAIGGLILGPVIGAASVGDDPSGWSSFGGFLAGLVLGPLVGGISGAMLASSRERWHPVSLP